MEFNRKQCFIGPYSALFWRL